MKKVILMFIVISISSLFADGVQPGGIGTENDPYQIETLNNLLWVSTNSQSWNSYFIQTSDIDASSSQSWNDGQGFSPIGSYPTSFSGNYNGDGYSVSDIYINGYFTNYQLGLFGYVINANISNVNVVSISIIYGYDRVGGIIGYCNNTLIENCTSSGSLNALKSTGGIVGSMYNNSIIINSTSSCNINCTDFFGGIVGRISESSIENSFYNYETVLINNSSLISVGAVPNEVYYQWVGNNYTLDVNDYLLQNDNNQYIISTEEDFSRLLFLGQFNYSFSITNNIDLQTFNGLYIPYFEGEIYGNGNSISNLSFVNNSASMVGLMGYTRNAYLYDINLTNFNLEGKEFVGSFIGLGENISIENCISNGVLISEVKTGGIAGSLRNSTMSFCESQSLITGESKSGGLVGVSRNLTINNSHNLADIDGEENVGGLVGYSDYNTTINQCSNLGNISGIENIGGLVGYSNHAEISNSRNEGNISGNSNVGAIAGWWLNSTIINSYYNYEVVQVNNQNIIALGAISNELYELWFSNNFILNIEDFLDNNNGVYQIYTLEDFMKLMIFGQFDYDYELMSDIDFDSEMNIFIPYFKGNFDGQGHVIDNFHYNMEITSNVGVFGIAENANIIDTGFTNSSITGGSFVGGIVGQLCNSVIDRCFTSGNISGNLAIGGLIGFSKNSNITNSYSIADISGEDYCGGFIGYLTDSIINFTYSNGLVSCEGGDFGGLIGESDSSEIDNSFWDIITSNQENSSGGTGLPTIEMTDYHTFLESGWDCVSEIVNGADDIWDMDQEFTVNNGYPILSWQEGADDILGGTTPLGSGTENDPYIIISIDNLNWVSMNYNSWDKYFLQQENINASVTYDYPNGIGFSPIGNESVSFTGSYNGSSYNIDSLFICNNSDYIGLFGKIQSCSVSNVRLLDCSITGGDKTGGLVGASYYSDIDNCIVRGVINGENSVGGLAGKSTNSPISNCISEGIINSYNGAGGLVGNNNSTICNSYSTCNVNATGSVISSNIGGLVGDDYGELINSFYNIDNVLLNESHCVTYGGIPDNIYNDWINNDLFIDINDYFSFTETFYEISNIEDIYSLLAFSKENYNFLLVNDIDLSEETNLHIPFFKGVFEGNGKVISNFTLDDDILSVRFGSYGFFSVTNDAIIQNLILNDFYINSHENSGSLIGISNNTQVSNCSSNGYIHGYGNCGSLIGESNNTQVSNCSSNGYLFGTYAGGLIGCVQNNSNIDNCYSRSEVHGWTVGGFTYAGGLIGKSISSNVINCYSTGLVEGALINGGLIGFNSYSIVENSFWDIDTSQLSTSYGGTGKSTFLMKSLIIYTNVGWDFIGETQNGTDDFWNIDNDSNLNDGYPYLRNNLYTDIDEDNNISLKEVKLYDNYPNPFNPTTTIDYYLPKDSIVNLSIYNIKGQKILTLVKCKQNMGKHSVQWDGYDSNVKKVSSGVYFYKLDTIDSVKVHKMILVK